MTDIYSNAWAVLTDKCYQRFRANFCAIHPKRQGRLQLLTLENASQNDWISHDRVAMENYFGRLKTLWAVCSKKWRWDENSYDMYFRTCLALTNAHARLRSLCAEEGDDNHRYEARLHSIGQSALEREAAKHSACRERRAARLAVSIRTHGNDSFESSSSDDELQQ
ncbi:hypothetical protein PF005_g13629 [Phytophthora fragariae]|uniref:DDE Tnp4 domain-containing protein n=2 Tax=Phytophthora fragariae TaxID=53985 RepID=A0A6A3S6K9_9STRA|nr:hypothetical protein PF003_g32613 [Phytophthora fragariae]KAE8935113.1 hypothetical protein PF009_g14925 [Phytophthora fragariae]KAE9005335.1 hypothetical protein PF011_g12088 [Phytophthora fragariae]KAE9104708.1 hypothetical protein PF010_g13291 [Phytophthora fragariae]KAE9106664.1 hypothetical protein PF007_g13322 [Phytophthora fragariae]